MADLVQVLVVAARSDEIDWLRRVLADDGIGAELRLARTAGEIDAALAGGCDALVADQAMAEALALVGHARRADGELPLIVIGDDLGGAAAALAAGADHFVGRGDDGWLAAALRRRAATSAFQHELRDILDRMPVGVLVRHGATIAYANRALAACYGVTPASLVGTPVAGLVRAEYHGATLARLAAIDRGEQPGPWEFRFDRADGRIGTMEHSTAQPLTFGRLPSVMSTLRDVTEERALRERLHMADRMAAIGTLASGVAHEINNPLACVTANLEVLREELAGEPRLRPAEMLEALDDAREGAERVRLIVRDLRLFARVDAGEREPVDLGGVLQAAERMAANLVKTRARVVQEHAPLPPVDGNATRLCQVFVNLLVNAAQAIAEGHPDENEVRVQAGVDGDRVVVEVRDTGAGIPPEVRTRIFDPFFSTKGVGGGTGLGLSVCHGIVTSLGGEISVRDGDTGRGTVVRVALPLWTR